jgi:dynein regulatory complex protein 1
MRAADEIVANKLSFIHELEQEVLRRDHEYVNTNAEHNRTVDTFVHQMRQQENDLRELIASELSKVLSSYDQERSTTIIQVQKEVKQLAAKRQEREQNLMKQTIQNANDQRDRLEALRQHQSQEYLMIRTSFEIWLAAAQKEYEDRFP